MSHQVFISYSSLDKKFAEKIYNYLNKNGITCWISSKDIPPGGDYQACIVEAIHQAQIVLLIFSANANSSNEIAKELSLASKKVLIPTRIEDVIPAGAFQYQLSNRQFIDLFEDFDNSLQELAHRIESALEGVQHIPLPPKRKSNWRKLSAVALAVLMVAGLGVGVWMLKSAPTGAGVAASPANTSATFGKAAVADVAVLPPPSIALAPAVTASAVPQAVIAALAKAATPEPIATPPAAPEGVVSVKVAAFAATIKDKVENQRDAALRTAKDAIPNNLNATEASLLLAKTGFYRASSIGVIAENIAAGQSGDATAVILGDAIENNRLTAIQSLTRADKIKNGLSGTESAAILRNSGFYRSAAIALLAENLQTNQDGAAMALVLGDAVENNRLSALQAVTRAGKIKNGLSASDAVLILKNMGFYRATAVAAIAENLAVGLDGDSVTAVLGDLQDNQRLDALQSFVRARKIKSGLQVVEAEAILKNTEFYRGSAVNLIAENLAGNLDGAGVLAVLGNSVSNSRLNALDRLIQAGKVKQGLKTDEVQNIVKTMESYQQPTAMKALAALQPK